MLQASLASTHQMPPHSCDNQKNCVLEAKITAGLRTTDVSENDKRTSFQVTLGHYFNGFCIMLDILLFFFLVLTLLNILNRELFAIFKYCQRSWILKNVFGSLSKLERYCLFIPFSHAWYIENYYEFTLL